MSKNKVLTLLVLAVTSAHAALPAAAARNCQLYTIAGLNRGGCEDGHVEAVFGRCADVSVPTPEERYSDLGQRRCINLLRDALAQHPEHQNIVVYAASQGTATVLNYLAQNPSEKRIKGLVLQAPLSSGNSSIVHTIRGHLCPLQF